MCSRVFSVLFFLKLGPYSVFLTAEAKISNRAEDDNWMETWVAPKEIAEAFPYYVQGFDIKKRPVFSFEVGQWPLPTWVNKGGKDLEDLTKHIEQLFYRIENGPKLFFNESEVSKLNSVVIADWKGFSLTQLFHLPTMRFMLHHLAAFRRIQESLAYGYFLNVWAGGNFFNNFVNGVAGRFLSIAKPIIGSAFKRIVETLGASEESWLPRILGTIRRDHLPLKYGGDNENFKPAVIYG